MSQLTVGHEGSDHPQFILSNEDAFVWENTGVVEQLRDMEFSLWKNKQKVVAMLMFTVYTSDVRD